MKAGDETGELAIERGCVHVGRGLPPGDDARSVGDGENSSLYGWSRLGDERRR